jgi:hypothetical protein
MLTLRGFALAFAAMCVPVVVLLVTLAIANNRSDE